MKKLLVTLMFPAVVQAQEMNDFVEPALIVGSVLVAQRIPGLNKVCTQDPCNAVSHAMTGYAVRQYVGKRYGWEMGLAAAIAVGVGKELLDKNFDAKDAVMTSFGSVQFVWTWEF